MLQYANNVCRGVREDGEELMRREGRRSIRLVLVMILFAGILCLAGSIRTPAASVKKLTMVKGQVRRLNKNGATWSSSRKKVAVVDAGGNVTALKKGTAVITAKVGKKKTRYRIKVQAPKLGKTSRKVKVGKSFSLKIKGTNRKFKWSSSNPSVAQVTQKKSWKYKCKVTGKRNGVARISAAYKGVTLTCAVTVGTGQPGKVFRMYLSNGDLLKTLTYDRTDTAKYVSSISQYGQSAPLYISADGGDGLENIWSEDNNGAIGVPGAKLSDAAVKGTIKKACLWARAVCDSPYHGYDNGHNYDGSQDCWAWGQAKPNALGTGDYCCYSIPLCAYYFAGVNVLGESLGGPDAKYVPHSTLLMHHSDVSFYGVTKKPVVSTGPYDSMYLYPRCGFKDMISSFKNNRSTFVFKAGDVATYGSHAQLIIEDGTKGKCSVAQAFGPTNKKQSKEIGGDQSYELGVGSLHRASDIAHIWRFTGEGVRLNTVGLID